MSARRTSPPSMGLHKSGTLSAGNTPSSSARPSTPPHSFGASGASILRGGQRL